MNFDPQTAFDYAASISRPRKVGSREHEQVAQDIEDRLHSWGYQITRELFTFSTASEVFLKLFLVVGMLLVLALLVWRERALAALLLVLVAAFMPLNRRVQSAALDRHGHGLRLGRRYTTTNLIATTPQASNLPQLYLVAHYDSKSQRMPLVVRITLFMLTVSAGLILVILALFDPTTALYLPIGLLVLAAAAPLLFLDVGNDSPGAIDNASSAGLVLHLAEVLARRADWQNKLNVTILIPSAEELTLMGSVAYVTAHEQELRDQARSAAVYVLNFDGIGIDGDLYYVGRSHPAQNGARLSLLTRVQCACAELNVPLKRFGFIGALFDHIPFAQRGFDAISLVAVGRASRSVHTPGDSIDKLHVRGFDQAGRVALRVIDQLIGEHS